jgi:hypothetical protein
LSADGRALASKIEKMAKKLNVLMFFLDFERREEEKFMFKTLKL